MRTQEHRRDLMHRLARRTQGEQGIVVVVVMMFCLIFLVLGLALYWLTMSQINATETERKDVKSFNVAEAGVDAGMLALKLDWPFISTDYVTIDAAMIKSTLQDDNDTLYDPERSDVSEFIQVEVYDNSVDLGGGAYETVSTPPDVKVLWDANEDGMMFVDATSNVQDDRHRILLLAERQTWNLPIPIGIALFASAVDTGAGVQVEVSVPPPGDDLVVFQVHELNPSLVFYDETEVGPDPYYSDFDEKITDSLIETFLMIAQQRGTYFEDDAEGLAEDKASDFLASGNTEGAVIYVKSDSEVAISGNDNIGSADFPAVVVIDTPDGSDNSWSSAGTIDFWGVLIVLGNTTFSGDTLTHGAIFTSGTLVNNGLGSVPEVTYDNDVLKNIQRQYTLSVNIVPNTWEEYTKPAE